MKKILLSVFAVAALASCIQNETINPQTPIGFGDAYVQNSTKAIYEGTNYVKAFKVWGTVTPNGGTALPLYEGANVTDTTAEDFNNYGKAWQCDVQRFWTPNCDYNFYAVVDADGVNATTPGVPSTIDYIATGENDLLYGATTKQVGADASNPGLVAFTMQHLLSKVSFKFTNTNTNSAYTYKVTKVEVLGAYTNGTYTITHDAANIDGNYVGSWAGTGKSETALSFLNGALTLANATVSDGNITASTATAPKSFVIIPGEPELNIAITVETLLNSAKIYSEDYTLKVNQAGGTDKTFVKNTHYNFVVALEGGKPIDFTIGSVGDFGAGADTTIQ